jgi:hypothetical protein
VLPTCAESWPGGPGGFGLSEDEPLKPGPKVSPNEVAAFPNAALHDETVLRTIFLVFEGDDWEAELADIHRG